MSTVRPFSLPMRQALKYWAAKIVLDADDFYRLAEDLRGRAFTVGALARANMVNDVYSSLGRALEQGSSFGEWKKSIADVIQASGWDRRRAELIFRTNVQSAFQAGRWKQMQAVKRARPYWRYVSVQDARTRPSHAALHGKVFHADDTFWDTFYPPNGYQCRCTVQTLSERQVEQYGYEVDAGIPGPTLVTDPRTGMETVISPFPDRGWETNQAKEAWTADLSKYPDWMRERLEQVV
ncbi:phage minor head protein [Desulfonatronum thiosulfatophilum]|uniref:phage head morphogenesis protein n=1 Tax=Desulfonatronum thiosulfatophilum TaxID=617002 RepID=UPI00137B66D4|nr:phage head morphogenesis protein [Desulfonatronum thiosulfatophilum]